MILKATVENYAPLRLDIDLSLQKHTVQILPIKIKTYIEKNCKWTGQEKDIVKRKKVFQELKLFLFKYLNYLEIFTTQRSFHQWLKLI